MMVYAASKPTVHGIWDAVGAASAVSMVTAPSQSTMRVTVGPMSTDSSLAGVLSVSQSKSVAEWAGNHACIEYIHVHMPFIDLRCQLVELPFSLLGRLQVSFVGPGMCH